MIKIKVRVYSTLNYYIDINYKHRWFEVILPNDSNLSFLVNKLKIPEEEIMFFVVTQVWRKKFPAK